MKENALTPGSDTKRIIVALTHFETQAEDEAFAEDEAAFEMNDQGIHWPDIDEDISVERMLHGSSARRPNNLAIFLPKPGNQ